MGIWPSLGRACGGHGPPPPPIVQESRPVLVDIDEAPTSNEQPSTAACSQAEEQTPLPVKPRPAQDGRWRRGGPDKENAVLIQKQQMAEMRQYFQEVRCRGWIMVPS